METMSKIIRKILWMESFPFPITETGRCLPAATQKYRIAAFLGDNCH